MVALVWVLLTTPATTLPALYLLDRPGSPLKVLQMQLPPSGMGAIVAFALIGLPLFGVLIASFALGRARSSWTPMRGGNYARLAMVVGMIAAIAGASIFIAGLFG